MTVRHLLLDGDLIVYSIGFSCQTKNPLTGTIEPNVGLYQMQLMVDEFLLGPKFQYTGQYKMRIFLSGESNFRKNLATLLPYKGHRKGIRPLYYSHIREYLVRKYDATVSEYEEADDLIGIAAKHEVHPVRPIICSFDKDLKTIPGLHYDWRKGNIKDNVVLVDELEASRNFYYQFIAGDRVDNIPSLYQLVSMREDTKYALKLKRGGYLKKAKETLEVIFIPDRMCKYVWRMYEEAGIPFQDFVEIGRLLAIRTEPEAIWNPPIDVRKDNE
jgi:hypothetical protein